ncbi:MAG: hypothetical protein HY706_14265 [Candidatus Hydrogenedentes bacterium]|nr:hypothetical protein [Candidatus Hydrogenedentota bacterium]
MERKQLLALIAVILVFVIALAIILVTREETATVVKPAKFRAKKGTTRENPLLLIGKDDLPEPVRKDQDTPSGGDTGKHVSIKKVTAAWLNPATADAEALNAPTPEDGIAELATALSGELNLAEASRLYTTLGTLYLQTEPTDFDAAQAAFGRATSLAQSPVDKHSAAYGEARMLVLLNQPQQAATVIKTQLEEEPTVTLPAMQLELLKGKVAEDLQDDGAAETAYRRAMDRTLANMESLGLEAEDVYRQAALRLARLYRRTDRAHLADALAGSVRLRLGEE